MKRSAEREAQEQEQQQQQQEAPSKKQRRLDDSGESSAAVKEESGVVANATASDGDKKQAAAKEYALFVAITNEYDGYRFLVVRSPQKAPLKLLRNVFNEALRRDPGEKYPDNSVELLEVVTGQSNETTAKELFSRIAKECEDGEAYEGIDTFKDDDGE